MNHEAITAINEALMIIIKARALLSYHEDNQAFIALEDAERALEDAENSLQHSS